MTTSIRAPQLPRALALLAAATLLAALACGPAARQGKPLALWVYCAANLADSSEVERLDALWRRARSAGYSRVVLADGKLARLGEMDAAYFAHLGRLLGLADTLGLEVVPGVFPIGRSNPLLALDPDLAEGLPVRNALFEARGGVARLIPDPPVAFDARPDLIDPEVTWSDNKTRIRDNRWSGDVARIRDNRRPARFLFRVPVAPYRCYRVSVRLATRGFTGEPRIEVIAAGRPIHFMKGIETEPNRAWTETTIAFHSLHHREVAVYFGVWGRSRGEIAWSGWTIEESGPFNVLRRPGAPFSARGAVEGRDFDPVRDPALGVSPWRGQYDAWHEPLVLRTRLPDGARFRASWYQAAVTHGGQVTACVSEPRLDSLLADQASRVRSAFGARTFLMMHDEIRALNWDASCQQRRRSPGAILAEHVRRCVALLPGAEVWVWSDMFDPAHNAIRDYALVNGDLAGSWEGLPRGVGVVNWNSGQARRSLRFFAARGHPQVLAGYYDGSLEETTRWLAAARGVPGVRAMLYTTWRGDYRQLERFAQIVHGAR